MAAKLLVPLAGASTDAAPNTSTNQGKNVATPRKLCNNQRPFRHCSRGPQTSALTCLASGATVCRRLMSLQAILASATVPVTMDAVVKKLVRRFSCLTWYSRTNAWSSKFKQPSPQHTYINNKINSVKLV